MILVSVGVSRLYMNDETNGKSNGSEYLPIMTIHFMSRDGNTKINIRKINKK